MRAKRWKHGWELHIDGIGVTQSRNLDGAEQMVRDYIETLTDHDTADDVVVIQSEVGGGKHSGPLRHDRARLPASSGRKACLAGTSRRSCTCRRSESPSC